MKHFFVILTIVGFVLSMSAYGQIPNKLSYQGLLTTSSGTPVADGSYDLKFEIYNLPSGGTLRHSETHTGVSVQRGSFSVLLGTAETLPAIFSESLYVEVTAVLGPAGPSYPLVFSPRSELTSAPYSLQSVSLLGPYSIVSSTAALAGGSYNRARGIYSVVSGGGGATDADSNSAIGSYSSVGGGSKNIARGSTSTIGGGYNNRAGSGTFGTATVGGGSSNFADDFGTVGGGLSNTAIYTFSTVGGGSSNTANGVGATIAGGTSNMTANGGTIGGGGSNVASGSGSTVSGGSFNSARGSYSVVSGGGGTTDADSNSAIGSYSSVGGGSKNIVRGSTSTIGGGYNNRAGSGTFGTATVGGGSSNFADDFGTVAGGLSNTAIYTFSTVGGGSSNTANGVGSTISGGTSNTTSSSGATIGGGGNNVANGSNATIGGGSNNNARGLYSVIGGGGGATDADSNSAIGSYSSVGGGSKNIARGSTSTIGGGYNNRAGSGTFGTATVSGGSSNFADDFGTVSGGLSNTAIYTFSTVGGGSSNSANGLGSTIGGGTNNMISKGGATIGGGGSNVASGFGATVPGGIEDTAGGAYSFAAGWKAVARHGGCFVWADSSNAVISSTTSNQFLIRASGGTKIYSNSAATVGVKLDAGAGSWTSISDSTLKRNIRSVNGKEILEKLARLPIKQWSYKTQDPNIEHIGPMAQDFYPIFHLGDDDKTISTIDPSGIALTAIQELVKQNQKLQTENEELNRRLTDMEVMLKALAVEKRESESKFLGLPAESRLREQAGDVK